MEIKIYIALVVLFFLILMHVRRLFYVCYTKARCCYIIDVAKMDDREKVICKKLIRETNVSAIRLFNFILWEKFKQKKSSRKTK